MQASGIRAPARLRQGRQYARRTVTPSSDCCLHSHPTKVPLLPTTPSTLNTATARTDCSAATDIVHDVQPTWAGRRAVLSAAGVLLSAGCFEWPALADGEESAALSSSGTTAAAVQQDRQVFINIKVDGKPFGRLTFELFPDVKIGSQRFADLCKGKQGVGYRLSKFDNINDSYIRNEGVKALAYNASGESPIAGGESVGDLEVELSAQTRRHDCAGLVSLVVKPDKELPVTEKLVAIGGKFVTVKNQAGEVPNGTSFVITRGPAPELDATNLIVGQLVGGWDVFDKMGALPVINDNQGSPFFKAGKIVGDKRALVAEKSFNKPFGKVVVANGGVVSGNLVASAQ